VTTSTSLITCEAVLVCSGWPLRESCRADREGEQSLVAQGYERVDLDGSARGNIAG
jgi:hypothetical protein